MPIRRTTRGRWIVSVGFAVAVVLGGCATSSSSKKDVKKLDGRPGEDHPKSGKVDLDPMLVKGGDEKGPGKTVDSKDVFNRAYEAYSDRRYEEAARHYEMIVEYFDESRFYRPALYNGGLAYEKLGRWESAAKLYRRIIEEFPKEESTTDAYYRLAQVYRQQGRHRKIVDLMTKVMLREDVEIFDRIEAHSRRANAALALGNLEEAEQGFRTLLKLNGEASPEEKLPKDSRYICQAYFGLGKLYHRRQSKIALELPTEKMGRDLERKAELLLNAQQYYLRALRQHHPKWSVASGYRIGRLYEDFYSDIFSAEIPEDLSEKQVAMYFESLRKKLRPVMKRAIDVYERNLSLSAKIGETPENNRWVAETAESLRRMKEFLNDPATQERAQELVRNGRDFRALWRPWDTARDRVESALDRAKKKANGGGPVNPGPGS